MNIFYIKIKIYNKLGTFLHKHKNFLYLRRTIRGLFSTEYRNEVLELGHNPNIMHIQCNGNLHLNRNIYFIKIGNQTMGLAGFLRFTIYGLYEAEKLGFTPVVLYTKDSPYYEGEDFMGTNNSFEYYFQRTSDISVDDIKKSSRVFLFQFMVHSKRVETEIGYNDSSNDIVAGYSIQDNSLKVLAPVVEKYLKLNLVTDTFIRKSIENSFPDDWKKEKVLAVHIRGTDFALQWDSHPNMVGLNDFVNAINQALAEKHFKYIFLATDDSTRLTELEKIYGDKLLYFKDVHRESGHTSVAMVPLDRENDHYLNGLEVLRDMYTLANCDGLVAGLSQVSICARIIKYSTAKSYEYIKILDKGIHCS